MRAFLNLAQLGCRVSLALCLTFIGSTFTANAYADRNDVTISVLEPKGDKIFRDCTGHMADHEKFSTDPIPVCFHGNGNYSRNARRVALREDWFPNDLFPSNAPIGEIRYVCSFFANQNIDEIQVIFPSQTEAQEKQRARIDIPCASKNSKKLKNQFQKIQNFFLALRNNPHDVIDLVQFPKTQCITGSPQNNETVCQVLRSRVRSIFEKTANYKLQDFAYYDGIAFNVGLNVRLRTFEAAGGHVLNKAFQDLTFDGSMRMTDYFYWLMKQMPSCAEPGGKPITEFSKCMNEANALIEVLLNKGIDIGVASWDVEVDHFDCNEITPVDADLFQIFQKCQLGKSLADTLGQILVRQSDGPAQVAFDADSAAKWSAWDKDYVDQLRFQNGQEDGYSIYAHCDTDAQCWSRARGINRRVANQAKQFANSRCMKVKRITYDSAGEPLFEFFAVPEC